jgi:CRISPR/Cas system-associated endoribonuclease Cas2
MLIYDINQKQKRQLVKKFVGEKLHHLNYSIFLDHSKQLLQKSQMHPKGLKVTMEWNNHSGETDK